ncbi:hypothetical protein [Halpernia frigidisoli]|uniref:Uncharacterized protein n=1 Tax=Halpernia frigidisoli TaxID=1125876 RepID=A0A1I3CX08_9FLAO|nr:hypothetical protein [Halpernia frigidisoli]SFH78809.1 hypothetical protein SAMN05443292_0120 [Halpernia frigidisoli]
MLTNLKINPIAKWLFLLSFALGNICFFGYLFSDSFYFAFAGYFLLLFGTVINLIVFAAILTYGFFHKENYKESLNSALLLLLNIPFAFLYAWIGLSILN